MRRLFHVALIVAANSLLTFAVLADLTGQHKILRIRFSTPILRCNASIDDTGLIVTRYLPRRAISFSTSSQKLQPQRWDRLFNSAGHHGWANSAFAYHDAYMGQISGVTIRGAPRYGVTHQFLILLSVILSASVYRKHVGKLTSAFIAVWFRTSKIAQRRA